MNKVLETTFTFALVALVATMVFSGTNTNFFRLVSADAPPATIALDATIRDFKAADQPGGHVDFQSGLTGDDPGIVQNTLGADGKPVYASSSGTTATTHGAAAFNQWYNDVSGVNLSTTKTLTLTKISDSPLLYQYDGFPYFPINNELFGNYAHDLNYHFTSEIHTEFIYESGQTFSIRSDDDAWVFINDKLVIDFGGVHFASGTVDLDSVASSIGITPGNKYNLDIFHAERQTNGSTLDITTSIVLVPMSQDTQPPTISGISDITSEATGPDGATVSYDLPTATDTVDESPTVECTPVSGSLFALGSTAVICSAEDDSNNQATASFFVTVVDTTAPTISVIERSPVPNANGWNNGDVTITFGCEDSVSVLAPSLTATVTGEGSGLEASGTCSDAAGNQASLTVSDINIDRTAPEVTGAAAEQPNENGWYSQDVTIEFSASDSLSGIDGPDNATETISEEGESQSASHTFTDLAGNSATGTVDGINLDKTAPELTVPDDVEVFPTSPDGSEVDFEAQAADNLDPSPEIEYSVEPGSTFAIGTTTVEITATDQAGNSIAGSFTVTVLAPEEAAEEMVEMMEDMDLPGGTENSFTSKLDAAIKSLEKGNEKPAQNQLRAFINHVEAQAGKSITEEQAEVLIEAAQDIIDSIS